MNERERVRILGNIYNIVEHVFSISSKMELYIFQMKNEKKKTN